MLTHFKNNWVPWLVFSVVILFWSFYWYFVVSSLTDSTERGQFGDMFGAINALFAGLAFGGVIWAVDLQRKELQLQRQEIAKQTAQLSSQDQTMKRQNFENSFFQLIGFYNNIVESLHFTPMKSTITGRRCFGAFTDTLLGIYQSHSKKDIDDIWELFFQEGQIVIGYYFRYLYNTIKFVHQHPTLSEFQDRKNYVNLIRAQLSSNELGLLFYNCLSKRGKKFKCLVEEYSLLEDMDTSVLLDRTHMKYFKEKAFGQVVY